MKAILSIEKYPNTLKDKTKQGSPCGVIPKLLELGLKVSEFYNSSRRG